MKPTKFPALQVRMGFRVCHRSGWARSRVSPSSAWIGLLSAVMTTPMLVRSTVKIPTGAEHYRALHSKEAPARNDARGGGGRSRPVGFAARCDLLESRGSSREPHNHGIASPGQPLVNLRG